MLKFKVNGLPYVLIAPDRDLVFPSIGYVRSVINEAAVDEGQSRLIVVVDCGRISAVDFTAAKGFKVVFKGPLGATNKASAVI